MNNNLKKIFILLMIMLLSLICCKIKEPLFLYKKVNFIKLVKEKHECATSTTKEYYKYYIIYEDNGHIYSPQLAEEIQYIIFENFKDILLMRTDRIGRRILHSYEYRIITKRSFDNE